MCHVTSVSATRKNEAKIVRPDTPSFTKRLPLGKGVCAGLVGHFLWVAVVRKCKVVVSMP